MNIALKASRLSVFFKQKVALNSINFTIPEAGVTALLGPNGAGKTTLINCALGLCKPNSGEIRIFDKIPGRIETKKFIGVMLQDSGLPDLLSTREHIELFSTYYPKALSVDELCQRCHLGRFIDKRYRHLSGGQKRRAQFALAILGQPKIVFLDEPTTGLDVDARKVVWNTISDLSNAGTTVLLSTHYLDEADSLADQTIVMNKGNVIANDTTAKIRALANGSIIRCQSNIELPIIKTLNHVNSVTVSGRQIEITTSKATTTIRELLALDSQLNNLTISKSSLEDAFIQLTQVKHKKAINSAGARS